MSENVNERNFTESRRADERENLRELVALAQKGDQNAFALLLKAYDPLITSMVAKFRVEGMSEADDEDLRQEAVLAFYSSLMSYDPGISGVEFGLYAKICICNRLVSQMRMLKRHLSYSVLSYDSEGFLARLASDEDPAAGIAELESERTLLRLINDNLSGYERRVFRMYVSGMSAASMAERLKTSEK